MFFICGYFCRKKTTFTKEEMRLNSTVPPQVSSCCSCSLITNSFILHLNIHHLHVDTLTYSLDCVAKHSVELLNISVFSLAWTAQGKICRETKCSSLFGSAVINLSLNYHLPCTKKENWFRKPSNCRQFIVLEEYYSHDQWGDQAIKIIFPVAVWLKKKHDGEKESDDLWGDYIIRRLLTVKVYL